VRLFVDAKDFTQSRVDDDDDSVLELDGHRQRRVSAFGHIGRGGREEKWRMVDKPRARADDEWSREPLYSGSRRKAKSCPLKQGLIDQKVSACW
jgi:hypothetical protein